MRLSASHKEAIGRASGGYKGGKRRWEWLDASGRLFRFRSGWELRFAQRLTEARIVWQYEPHALLLSDGRIYLPDFFVEAWQAYIEIKGWHGWRTMEKYELAVKDGHRVRLVTDPGIAIEELAQLAAL